MHASSRWFTFYYQWASALTVYSPGLLEKLLIMANDSKLNVPPLILAPAGNKASFLAALAAGADAVYCGLKQFSARHETKNFSIEELEPLTQLARERGTEVYVAFNSLVKPTELDRAGRLIERLNRSVKPNALIIQDLALIHLARQTGYSGELHLSTLANVSFAQALKLVHKQLGVDRIVVPRELSIDEIKAMALACPQGLNLEVFVHGALCYGVSGRCYWSSYLGGKSGLRGRCVQPCRRLYTQDRHNGQYFSCQDLSLDVLSKVLLSVPQVRAWKIEGRKKSPHYVYHTVKAYQLFRDQGRDPQMKKTALELLDRALGRPRTHYNFLPQRPQNPIKIDGQTGSGLLVGTVKGTKAKPFIVARETLLPGDVLRIGYEDQPWYGRHTVGRHMPTKGRLYLKRSSKKSPVKGVPVFLTDRREATLASMITELEDELGKVPGAQKSASKFTARLPKRSRKRTLPLELRVYRKPGKKIPRSPIGLWLSTNNQIKLSKSDVSRIWWWLPPVIWPENETKIKKRIDAVLQKGGRTFVLNAPWQTVLFKTIKGLTLWSGPFGNIANPLAVDSLASLGFKGAIISPEMGREDIFELPKHSPLPLGIIISGNWPLCISRVISDKLNINKTIISPKGEQAWIRKYDSDYWIYPNWSLDLLSKKYELQQAGYGLLVHLTEPIPRAVKLKKRPGLWNWDINLL